METTRNLSGTDVSKEAVESVNPMTIELANQLVKDYITSLNQIGKTLNSESIDRLTKHVIDNAAISMKIGLKVNAKIIDDIGITVQDVNQAGFNEFKT